MSRRQLFLEGLERRAVLAGDVMAVQAGGNLLIHGDADANGIHMQLMNDGTVEVSGMEAGGSATTINGSSEPFVANNVRFITRVQLGNGDDNLTIDQEAGANTSAGSGAESGTDSTADNSHMGWLEKRLQRFYEHMGNGANAAGQQRLMIHTGAGNDTVDATVSANVRVQMLGNTTGDDISIQTPDDTSRNDPSTDDGSMTGGGTSSGDPSNEASTMGTSLSNLSVGTTSDMNADANVSLDDSAMNTAANANVDASSSSSLDPNAVAAALNTDINAAIDAAGQLTTGGISTNSDLDSALTANLALSSALNSASNLGTSSLVNTDQNLNGSIGGSAALNLAGDGVFDEIGLFNNSSLSNIDADLAAQLALANANNFGVAANNVDDFFANLNSQSDLNAQAGVNANTNAGIFGIMGDTAVTSPGSLNSNINGNLSNAFQSRLGLPLG